MLKSLVGKRVWFWLLVIIFLAGFFGNTLANYQLVLVKPVFAQAAAQQATNSAATAQIAVDQGSSITSLATNSSLVLPPSASSAAVATDSSNLLGLPFLIIPELATVSAQQVFPTLMPDLVKFSSLLSRTSSTEDFSIQADQQTELPYVDGEVIVKFKKDKLDVTSLFGKVQAFVFKTRFSLKKTDEITGPNIQIFTSEKSTQDLVVKLKQDKDVEYVEPNFKRFPSAIATNDPARANLWGLDNTGQTVNSVAGTNDADIDAPAAWAVSEGSNQIIVAIIDSGVAYAHPDLIANMWDGTNCVNEKGEALGSCNHGYDYLDDDRSPLPTSSSHGTHIAGTIAAAKNNSTGIIGVAPNAKIMAIKYANDVVSEVKAIDFAIQNGAKIINASFGSYTFSQAEYDAINRFRTAGGIYVASAGNGGSDGVSDNNELAHNYPSDYDLDNIISVAATDQNDVLASFSNYGAVSIDVAAPGVNIYSTIADITTVAALDENFDGLTAPGLPSGWTTTPANFWGTYDLGSPSFNVLYGDAYNAPYVLTANATATSSTYNLAGAASSTISFISACDTEYDANLWTDYMSLEASSDGTNFTELLKWDEPYLDYLNGDPADAAGIAAYYFQDLPLANSYLTANFKLRFRWVANGNADAGSTGDGCKIDALVLNKLTVGSVERYEHYNGTSMATPHVVGLAALIWGYKPSLTAAQVRTQILSTGDALASLSGKTVTGKRINAYGAISALNTAPTTSAGSATPVEDTPTTLTLTGSDIDNDSLTYSIVSAPTHGILGSISGNQVTYTPATNYNGLDSFTFKANDGSVDSNTSTVSIVVSAVNDLPVASNVSVSTQLNTQATITFVGSDAEADILRYALDLAPTHGTLGEIVDDQVIYTPTTGYVGADSFSYSSNDGSGTGNTATVTLDISTDRTLTNPTSSDILNDVNSGFISFTGSDPTAATDFTFNLDYVFNFGTASVSFPINTVVTKIGGGELDLTSFDTSDNTIEIQAESANVLGSVKIGIPSQNLAFSNAISISIPVGASYNGQTLMTYYRSEGASVWVAETTCLVTSGLCSFQSTHATTFATRENTIAQNSASNNSSQSVGSSTQTPVCTDSKPASAPNLFQINASSATAKLFFSPVSNSNKYFISFSTQASAEEHGTEISLGREGVQSHTLYLLKPNTTYFFKVRAQNGCMPGDWSNIMSSTTPRFSSSLVSFFKNALAQPVSKFWKKTAKVTTKVVPAVPVSTPKNPGVILEPTALPKAKIAPTNMPDEVILPTSKPIQPQPSSAPATKPSTPAPSTATPKKTCFLWWCF